MLTVLLPLAQMNLPAGSATSAPAGSAPAPAATVSPATATGGAAPETTASTGTAPATGPASRPAEPPGLLGNFGPLLIMGLMLAALYFFMTRGQRKEEKRRKDMMGDLKKGDRVMTIGGMLASVVSVDDDRVVLKIDESNNVKATYRKSAIQEVIDRDEKK